MTRCRLFPTENNIDITTISWIRGLQFLTVVYWYLGVPPWSFNVVCYSRFKITCKYQAIYGIVLSICWLSKSSKIHSILLENPQTSGHVKPSPFKLVLFTTRMHQSHVFLDSKIDIVYNHDDHLACNRYYSHVVMYLFLHIPEAMMILHGDYSNCLKIIFKAHMNTVIEQVYRFMRKTTVRSLN